MSKKKPEDAAALRAEIEELLVDTYSEDEQAAAWEVAFSDGVTVPFSATLLGAPITVRAFRLADSNAIQCLVVRDKREKWIGVEDMDAEGLPDDMIHVLQMYRAWVEGNY